MNDTANSLKPASAEPGKDGAVGLQRFVSRLAFLRKKISPEQLPVTWKHHMKRGINWVKFGEADLWNQIGIAISKGCNRAGRGEAGCWYCPQSFYPLKQQIITSELWSLFLQRVRESEWKGKIYLHDYNEPSIVPNSENYVHDIVSLGCKPMLFTNGDRPLVIRKWIEAGVYRVDITEHPPFRKEWWEALRPLIAQHPITVRVRRLGQHSLLDRGGLIKNMPEQMRMKKITRCFGAVDGIALDVNGTTHLCCEDYSKETSKGDLRTMSLREIWECHNPSRTKVRQGIPVIKACVGCGLEASKSANGD